VPPDPRRASIPVLVGGAALVIAAVGIVYADAVGSYLVDDDFHWLQRARHFRWSTLVDLNQFSHFYRPLIEIYFFIGQRIVGCAALPFHLASVAIHLLNTFVLGAFAWRLTGHVRFVAMAVPLFAVQPGFVEAVAWVAAITDLLPALWYLLALLAHLVFLQSGNRRAYTGSLLAFLACLLTHESAATLLPMMVGLELLLILEGRLERGAVLSTRRVARYLPFAALLVAFLAVAYIVNSRSYLVQEGYYAVGAHAFTNAFYYIVALYVGERTAFSYILIAAAIGAIAWRGTLRMRFFLAWILVTLLPVLFFTWGIASRYLYVPAAGFALLLSDLLLTAEARAVRRLPPRPVRAATAILAIALAVRFAAFAQDRARGFRERTRPYERLVAAIAASNTTLAADRSVFVAAEAVENVPDLYRNPAAEEALCTPDVRLIVR
jgi:hypothetical protein